jgi:hypothetical protein
MVWKLKQWLAKLGNIKWVYIWANTDVQWRIFIMSGDSAWVLFALASCAHAIRLLTSSPTRIFMRCNSIQACLRRHHHPILYFYYLIVMFGVLPSWLFCSACCFNTGWTKSTRTIFQIVLVKTLYFQLLWNLFHWIFQAMFYLVMSLKVLNIFAK